MRRFSLSIPEAGQKKNVRNERRYIDASETEEKSYSFERQYYRNNLIVCKGKAKIWRAH